MYALATTASKGANVVDGTEADVFSIPVDAYWCGQDANKSNEQPRITAGPDS